MKYLIDVSEYRRWVSQAKHTLNSMEADINFGSYDWACFKAHQAAEYALKALLRAVGKPAFGHDLKRLSKEVNEVCGELNDELFECLLYLNKMYIPPRYPNAFSEGAPHEYFTRNEALRSKECVKKVISWVEECVGRFMGRSD
ncbi:MAG: DNA-binding protein [Desulfurococcales archaeon ex4484_42]|nr:MAG: DNA-binding protein [Desulfurococcales archaeon ex4484_42]